MKLKITRWGLVKGDINTLEDFITQYYSSGHEKKVTKQMKCIANFLLSHRGNYTTVRDIMGELKYPKNTVMGHLNLMSELMLIEKVGEERLRYSLPKFEKSTTTKED